MNVEEKLWCEDYNGVIILSDVEFEDALIGVTTDNRSVYNFEKMVECLIKKHGLSDIEAIEKIEYNILNSLSQLGNKAPIIMYSSAWLGI